MYLLYQSYDGFGNIHSGFVCVSDLDECADGSDNCDVNAECTNMLGGFECACNIGFTGDGTTCAGNIICTIICNIPLNSSNKIWESI